MRWNEPLDENPWFLSAVANYVKDKYPEIAVVEIHQEGLGCIARIILEEK